MNAVNNSLLISTSLTRAGNLSNNFASIKSLSPLIVIKLHLTYLKSSPISVHQRPFIHIDFFKYSLIFKSTSSFLNLIIVSLPSSSPTLTVV